MLSQYTITGMGDVIQSFASTYDFCTQNDIPFKLLFNTGKEKRGDIQQYFDISGFEDGLIKNISIDDRKVKIGDVVDGDKIDLIVFRAWWNDWKTPSMTLKNIDVEYAKTHNVLIVSSASGIYFNDGNGWKEEYKFYDIIKPSTKMQASLDEYMKANNWDSENRPVGMHIRRTDHKKVIRKYPTSTFITKIDELIEENPNVRIFLCTDDPNLRHSLIEKYSKNIFTRDSLKRGEEGATWDAMMDMLLLSKCSKIYGTYSGFCKMASRFGHIELIDVNKSVKSIDISTRDSINEEEFYGHESLTSVVPSKELKSIGRRAFTGCVNIKDWDFSFCNQLTSIGDDAFKGEKCLTNIKLPSSIEILGGCFPYCKHLVHLDISNLSKVQEIANWFCFGSSSLEEILMPESIKTIGEHAFGNCYSLKMVDFSKSKQIPVLESNKAFFGVNLDGLKIIVPSELLDEWKKAPNWDKMSSCIVLNK